MIGEAGLAVFARYGRVNRQVKSGLLLFDSLALVALPRFLNIFFEKFLELLFFYVGVGLVFFLQLIGRLGFLGRKLEKMGSRIDRRLKVAPIHLNLKYKIFEFSLK